MGLSEREYMRAENRDSRRAVRTTHTAPLWSRLMFRLWSWWRALRGKR